MFYVNERSKGGNGARNTGICKARGEFIAFLDDDDEWHSLKLKVQVERLRELDETWGGVYGPFEVLRRGNWLRRSAEQEGEFLASLLDSSAPVCAGSTLMVRQFIFEQIGLFDETLKRQQDLELLCRFFEKYKLATVSESIAKIYGHNPPEPFRAEVAKYEFFEIIDRQLQGLSEKEKSKVYAHHFRELSLLFAWSKKPAKTYEYMIKSCREGGFNTRNMISPLFHLAFSYIGIRKE